METWKNVKRYPNYQISCLSNVKSVKRDRLLKPSINNHGYYVVRLSNGKKSPVLSIHRLLAMHFVKGRFKGACVNHIDGNKLNNDLSNLEWTTNSENIRHAHRIGLFKHNSPMIALPNNCKCSEPAVHPKNWKAKGADVTKPWFIHYRFYDSAGNVKQVAVRGMNKFTDLYDRQDDTRHLLGKVKEMLLNGFNPFKPKDYLSKAEEVHPDIPLYTALLSGVEKIKCSKHTKECLDSAVKVINKAATDLKYHTLPVSKVKRKHVKLILARCQHNNSLSPGSYNHYRAYLLMIFKELMELDAVEFNPVKDVSKQKELKKIRGTLSREEREIVKSHLQTHYYSFYRYLQIFFHSGARSTELLKLQVKDVHLDKQYFKLVVLKGNNKKEVLKVIKDLALPYWTELLKGAKPTDYVFSKGLKPGAAMIRVDQVSKRWYRLIKKSRYEEIRKLNITSDFYSIKHIHTDSIAENLGIEIASEHNSHNSINTTKIYAVNEEERNNEKLRKLNNPF